MRKLSLALTLAAGLLFSSSHAFAALVTEDVGTLTKLNPSASYGFAATTDPNFKLDGAGQGQFRVNFSLGDASGHTGTSLTARTATPSGSITAPYSIGTRSGMCRSIAAGMTVKSAKQPRPMRLKRRRLRQVWPRPLRHWRQ